MEIEKDEVKKKGGQRYSKCHRDEKKESGRRGEPGMREKNLVTLEKYKKFNISFYFYWQPQLTKSNLNQEPFT